MLRRSRGVVGRTHIAPDRIHPRPRARSLTAFVGWFTELSAAPSSWYLWYCPAHLEKPAPAAEGQEVATSEPQPDLERPEPVCPAAPRRVVADWEYRTAYVEFFQVRIC